MTLLTKELSGPNGIAFSPDEKYLYVDNWDLKRKVLMRYEVHPDGTLGQGRCSTTSPATPSRWRWMASRWTSKATCTCRLRGAWILSPAGKALGRIVPPEHDANFTFGGSDGRALYLTASTGLYRIQVGIPGLRPGAPVQAASLTPVGTH